MLFLLLCHKLIFCLKKTVRLTLKVLVMLSGAAAAAVEARDATLIIINKPVKNNTNGKFIKS